MTKQFTLLPPKCYVQLNQLERLLTSLPRTTLEELKKVDTSVPTKFIQPEEAVALLLQGPIPAAEKVVINQQGLELELPAPELVAAEQDVPEMFENELPGPVLEAEMDGPELEAEQAGSKIVEGAKEGLEQSDDEPPYKIPRCLSDERFEPESLLQKMLESKSKLNLTVCNKISTLIKN